MQSPANLSGPPLRRPTRDDIRAAHTVITHPALLRKHFAPAAVADMLDTAWGVLRANATRPAPMIHAGSGGDAA